ncbi:MAG: hypothetical protein HOM11_09600 [Methylococcales bacterium]|mgnify:CR=1 FL=1|jgi:hypothetical protein|nr:hypothetical protein [Methylococcales bacterium]MBT7442536.1 hypothetical protein [Methylococcales bacterium]
MRNPPPIPYIIDIEASGFGPESYPIEVGIVLNQESYCSLIQPASDWVHWDKQAESVHQVPRPLLFTHGKPAQDVAEELNHLLAGKTVYSDGWVVDKPWLIRLFETARVRQQFTISAIEMILSEQQLNIWDQCKLDIIEQLKLERHRASNDALIIQQTYIRTLQLTY